MFLLPCARELPSVDGASRVSLLPFLSKKALTAPEGKTWNSAALVVSTIGSPDFISTLIVDACGEAGAAGAVDLLQLALISVNINVKKIVVRFIAEFPSAPGLLP